MTRTFHLILQGVIQTVQIFVSAPGVELSPNWKAFAHAALAGLTLIVAGIAQEYNTDGSKQSEPFGQKPEGRDE